MVIKHIYLFSNLVDKGNASHDFLILLNHSFPDKISATETRRQKLSYEVFETCTAEAATTWDELLAKNWKEKFDDNVLLAAVKAGVLLLKYQQVLYFNLIGIFASYLAKQSRDF